MWQTIFNCSQVNHLHQNVDTNEAICGRLDLHNCIYFPIKHHNYANAKVANINCKHPSVHAVGTVSL